MRNLVICCTFLFFAASVNAQGYAIDPQTGRQLPLTADGRYAIYPNGQTVPVVRSHHASTCQQAQTKLERSRQMARQQGRPLPSEFERNLLWQVDQLCR
jgi:hypothetical protein